MAGHQDQILDFIRQFPGRDDDEIAQALRISPRQTVNQVCRILVAQGLIDRVRGESGKLINRPVNGANDVATTASTEIEIIDKPRKPKLNAEQLLTTGFSHSGTWRLSESKLWLDGTIPNTSGVYAFVKGSEAVYVGITSMGFRKRMYFYANPGPSQSTNIRVNERIRQQIEDGKSIDLFTAIPPDFKWNGLLINGRAGLEIGLIETFELPWNVRGKRY